jgi:hypothetical protein
MEWMFTGQSAVISGVVVDYGGVPERMRDTVVAKIASALRILTRFDGRRVQRLVRYGTRIVVAWPLGPSSHPERELRVMWPCAHEWWIACQMSVGL